MRKFLITSTVYLSLLFLWGTVTANTCMLTMDIFYPEHNSSQELYFETREKLGMDKNSKIYPFLTEEQKNELRDSQTQYFTFGKVKEASSSPEQFEHIRQIENKSVLTALFIGMAATFLGLAVSAFLSGVFNRVGFPVFLTIVWGIALFYMQFGGRSYTYSLPLSFYITESLRLLVYLLCFFAVGYFSSLLGIKSVANFKSKKVQVA